LSTLLYRHIQTCTTLLADENFISSGDDLDGDLTNNNNLMLVVFIIRLFYLEKRFVQTKTNCSNVVKESNYSNMHDDGLKEVWIMGKEYIDKGCSRQLFRNSGTQFRNWHACMLRRVIMNYRSENQPYHFQLESHFYAQLKLHTLMMSPRIENIGKRFESIELD
jgi:hypothetical protein